MGIKGFLRRTGTKAADTVAKLSVLSPEQLDQMAEKRNEYLTQIPDLTDGAAEELTRRLMAAAGIEIYKEYLDHLDDLYIVLDTCSGSVHVVDEIAYEIIGLYESRTKEEIVREVSARFHEDAAEVAWVEA